MTESDSEKPEAAGEVCRSTDDAYGREVSVVIAQDPCNVCGAHDLPRLSVDTSDGEYLTFTCCGDCFLRLIAKAAKTP